MSARSKKPYKVWAAITVFVQGEDESAPWTKRSRSRSVVVQGLDFDHAMERGERELARQLMARFHLAPQS